MDNYPDDIRNYDYDPRSPFYTDYSDGLDELSLEELYALEAQAESSSEDEDCPQRIRHRVEKSLSAIRYEIQQRN